MRNYKTNVAGIAAAAILVLAGSVNAGSPPNISVDIEWAAGLGAEVDSIYDIEQAFNYARRQEEIQLSLAPNTIKNLVLPTQANWDALSNEEKALYVMNDERTSRAGMQSGVLGLPYAGVEANIDRITEAHADYLFNNNLFQHSSANGDSPYDRADNDSFLGSCHEFSRSAENIARLSIYTSGTPTAGAIPLSVSRAIYNWNYDDSGSAWGHRETSLAQDVTFVSSLNANQPGYTDNHGTTGQEGFIGLSFKEGSSYTISAPSAGFNGWGSLVTMNMFDPLSDSAATAAGCNYNVRHSTSSLPSARTVCDAVVTVPNNQWQVVSLPCDPGSSNTVVDIFGDDISGVYGTDWVLYSFVNSSYNLLSATSVVEPGEGYWIVQDSGSAVTLDMPDGSFTVAAQPNAAMCSSEGGCIAIPLSTNASGTVKTVKGRPFELDASVEDASVETNTSGACPEGSPCELTTTHQSTQVGGPWTYNGSGYSIATTFQPWEGYWFAANSSVHGHAPEILLPLY